jgi:DNA-binding response OmpR family regulator
MRAKVPVPPLKADHLGASAWVKGADVRLTRTERRLLEALVEDGGGVVSCQSLLERVWGSAVCPESLTSYIGQLRRKLGDDPAAPTVIVSVRGLGYRMGVAARGTEKLCFDGLQIEPASHRVWPGKTEPNLTPLEFSLLLELARNPGRVVSRRDLLTKFWGAPDADPKSLGMRIGRLRYKLGDDPDDPRLIVAVRGVGYCFTGGRGKSDDS